MRQLSAILFADIVGFTSIMGTDEHKAHQVIDAFKHIAQPLVTEHEGKWHKDLGDGALCSFTSAAQAVHCAAEIQGRVLQQDTFQVRIGIHLGDVVFENGDVIGDGVNLASRIQGEADAGGVAISEAVYRSIKNQTDLKVRYLGKRRLKNVEDRIRLYQLKLPGVVRKRRAFQAARHFYLIFVGCLIGFGMAWVSLNKMQNTGDEMKKLSITFPENSALHLIGAARQGVGLRAFDISPDAERLVYTCVNNGAYMLACRKLNSFDVDLLEGTEGAYHPTFSPDGTQVCYFANGFMHRISLNGLEITSLGEVVFPLGMAWATAEEIYVLNRAGSTLTKYYTDPATGSPEVIPTGRFYGRKHNLTATPHARNLIFNVGDGLYNLDLTTYNLDLLLENAASADFLMDDLLIFRRSNQLLAVDFDQKEMVLAGNPVPVVDNIRSEALVGHTQYAISDDGTLIYATGENVMEGILVIIDSSGKEIDTIGLPVEDYGTFAISPDNRFLLYSWQNRYSDRRSKLWLYDSERDVSTVIEDSAGLRIWSPDGSSMTYSIKTLSGYAIIDRSIDGLTTDTILFSDQSVGPYSWSQDKRFLAYFVYDKETLRDLYMIDRLNPETPPMIISNETDIEMFASFAPNGKYVVYESETVEGKSGIYVQPIPRTGEKIKIATDAAEPYWIEDGKQIVFRSKNYDRMYSVEVDFTDGFSAGTPELLWQGYYLNVPGRSYCVTSNGNLFLMKKSIETNHQRQSLNVIENWQLEVREALQD